ncbi:MAG: hypothetical protein HYZ25_19780 [Chloroflexi bacterium]|nr:hypothetical protein [Chloroflexota bacterium]
MSWWSEHKKHILLPLAGFVILVGVLITSLMLLGPVIGDTFSCTLVVCFGSIHVDVFDLPASEPYLVKFEFPSGKTEYAYCRVGEFNFEEGCSETGAHIFTAPDVIPENEVLVTIMVNGKQVSERFYPEYKKTQPNGKNCAPTCYYAAVNMTIPKTIFSR